MNETTLNPAHGIFAARDAQLIAASYAQLAQRLLSREIDAGAAQPEALFFARGLLAFAQAILSDLLPANVAATLLRLQLEFTNLVTIVSERDGFYVRMPDLESDGDRARFTAEMHRILDELSVIIGGNDAPAVSA